MDWMNWMMDFLTSMFNTSYKHLFVRFLGDRF